MHKVFHLQSHYRQLKAFYLRYERLLMPATLVVGFLVDYLTFTNIQIGTTLALLLAYWAVAGATIVFIHLYDAAKLPQKLRYIRLFAPLLIQFTFGALLGGSFIFYWFSGSLSASWPFILLLVLLMVSNDVFRHHFERPVLQVSVYFFICLSLFSVILPFFFNSLSPWLFVLAGILSSLVIYLLIVSLAVISPSVKRDWRRLLVSILVILLGMNFLYFTNVIPPIPLALREAGAYHNIQRVGGSYKLLGEPESLWQKLVPGQTLHLLPGERAFVYSAIFAPAELKTAILHHWQYYDGRRHVWVSSDKQSFNIVGGRKEGYRGFSWKTDPAPGTWRVRIETESGKVLGSLKFEVERVAESVVLEEVAR